MLFGVVIVCLPRPARYYDFVVAWRDGAIS
jgi:hypothetical protein